MYRTIYNPRWVCWQFCDSDSKTHQNILEHFGCTLSSLRKKGYKARGPFNTCKCTESNGWVAVME